MFIRKYRFKFYLNARHTVTINDKNSKVHPHTWEIVVFLDKQSDRFTQFSKVEDRIQRYLSKFESKLLNSVSPFDLVDPSLENIGEVFFEEILTLMQGTGWSLEKLEISENPTRTYIVSCEDSFRNTIQNNDCFASKVLDKKVDEATTESIDKMVKDETALEDLDAGIETSFCNVEHDKCLDAGAKKPGIKDTRRVSKKYILVCFIIILIASVPLILWLTRNGMHPWGSDTWGHLFKANLLFNESKSGNLYPLYSNLWYNGTQPFRYWAPLPYYILFLFEMAAGGNIVWAYNIFIVFVFIAGALGWILWGAKTERYRLALVLALLWFFLPDNLRVFFSEGNIPRVMVTTIFPYLLLGVWDYLENQNSRSIFLIFGCMFLITLCHAMISAMVGITIFLYVFLYALALHKIKPSITVLTASILGICMAGLWLYPALKGGMISLNQEAVIETVKELTMSASVSLNPLLRLQGGKEIFYFGISILLISIFGLIFADNKSRTGFLIVILIFIGTTKTLLPVIVKLPMSQLFWMWRFTPLAMGLFFASLLSWKDLRKNLLAGLLIIITLDSAVSFYVLGYNVDISSRKKDFDPAVKAASQGIAVLDMSRYGSFPSFYIGFNEIKSEIGQVFGWAYQGSRTSSNLAWLNTAVEKGWYGYLFDRCLEHGADTLIIKKELVNDEMAEFLQTALKAGYQKIAETQNGITLKYPVEYTFGTKVKYDALGIGRYASNMSFIFPQLETGGSVYLDDYIEDDLLKYKLIFLSGFEYRDKAKAESLIKDLSQKGLKFIIDMTGAKEDIYTSRASFLEVTAQPVEFTGKFTLLDIDGKKILPGPFPNEYSKWRTLYLENLDTVSGSTLFNNQRMNFMGTKINDNINFIGLNLPFFVVETKDKEALKILEAIVGFNAYEPPLREIVRIDIRKDMRKLIIKAEKEGVVTNIAALDSFKSVYGAYDEVHNLIFMKDRELELKIGYPYFYHGLFMSLAGAAGIMLFYFLQLKDRKKRTGLHKELIICEGRQAL